MHLMLSLTLSAVRWLTARVRNIASYRRPLVGGLKNKHSFEIESNVQCVVLVRCGRSFVSWNMTTAFVFGGQKCLSTNVHGVTICKKTSFMLTAVRTSHITSEFCSSLVSSKINKSQRRPCVWISHSILQSGFITINSLVLGLTV